LSGTILGDGVVVGSGGVILFLGLEMVLFVCYRMVILLIWIFILLGLVCWSSGIWLFVDYFHVLFHLLVHQEGVRFLSIFAGISFLLRLGGTGCYTYFWFGSGPELVLCSWYGGVPGDRDFILNVSDVFL